MKKEDAPRLKRFLGSLMRNNVGPLPMKELVEIVRDMEWLAAFAESLEKPPMAVVSNKPIDKKSKK